MLLRSRGIAFVLLSSLLLANEPSAFESQSGATKKDIKSLKDSSLNLSSIIVDLQSRVETLEQVQYGLQSLYDSQNQNLQKVTQDLENNVLFAQENRARFELLKDQVEQIRETQKQYLEVHQNLSKLISDLEGKLQNITQVSSDLNAIVMKEFEGVKNELKKQAEVLNQDQDNIKKLSLEIEKIYQDRKREQERNAFKQVHKKPEVLQEAKKLYQEKKNDEARDRLIWLIEQGYKKAESNFYLGQIAYRQKQYQDAIFYYKESAVLNDKAKYMPELLLNTIKSFDVLKDKSNTLKFIDTLLALYPQSKEADEAKKIQSKIKGVQK